MEVDKRKVFNCRYKKSSLYVSFIPCYYYWMAAVNFCSFNYLAFIVVISQHKANRLVPPLSFSKTIALCFIVFPKMSTNSTIKKNACLFGLHQYDAFNFYPVTSSFNNSTRMSVYHGSSTRIINTSSESKSLRHPSHQVTSSSVPHHQ